MEKKLASSLASLGKVLNGIPPCLCESGGGATQLPVAVAQYDERLHVEHGLVLIKKVTLFQVINYIVYLKKIETLFG